MARKPDRPQRETPRQARNAVGPKQARAVRPEAADAGVEADDDAGILRAAAAEKTAEIAEATARRGRRR